MKKLFPLAAICIAAAPVAVVVTLLLSPFWSWFEAKSGIESLGHSGPADWCFGVDYLLVTIVGIAAWMSFRK